jgi:hypothetical protein
MTDAVEVKLFWDKNGFSSSRKASRGGLFYKKCALAAGAARAHFLAG